MNERELLKQQIAEARVRLQRLEEQEKNSLRNSVINIS